MPEQTQPAQAGTLLVFTDRTSPERAKVILAQIVAKYATELDFEPKINTFNPNWGYPTFYIP